MTRCSATPGSHRRATAIALQLHRPPCSGDWKAISVKLAVKLGCGDRDALVPLGIMWDAESGQHAKTMERRPRGAVGSPGDTAIASDTQVQQVFEFLHSCESRHSELLGRVLDGRISSTAGLRGVAQAGRRTLSVVRALATA